MSRIGLQLYSLKELAEENFFLTLEKVAKAGYEGVEFAGYFDTPSKELREKLAELGLEACGSHVSITELENNLDDVIAYSNDIKNPYIVCPGLPEEYRNSEAAYKKTAELFNEIGERCAKDGIQFGYHNHDVELQTFNGRTGLDILLEETNPQYVFFELDTYWVEVTGNSSVKLMNQWKNRFKLLHIKDMVDWMEKENTEVGNGVLDIEAFVDEGKKHGVAWNIVEQEAFDKDPIRSIKESLDYLKSIQ